MGAITSIVIPEDATLPTGADLTDSVRTIINSRYKGGENITARVPASETLADLYGNSIPIII